MRDADGEKLTQPHFKSFIRDAFITDRATMQDCKQTGIVKHTGLVKHTGRSKGCQYCVFSTFLYNKIQ